MLENGGFVVAGRITLEPPDKFLIEFNNVPEAQSWTPAVYAFRIGGEVVRIGKAWHKLGVRIRQWNRDVSRALAGEFRKGGTNPWEAFEFRRRLIKHLQGEFLAKIGPTDKKLLRQCETQLIRDYNPCLCNDSADGRLRSSEARSVKDPIRAKEYWQSLNKSV